MKDKEIIEYVLNDLYNKGLTRHSSDHVINFNNISNKQYSDDNVI